MDRLVILFALGVLGCGSSDSTPKPTDAADAPRANPCATPGATYLDTYETVSGTCGDIPANISNIGDDGTVPAAAGLTCSRVEQDGCRAHDTGCRLTQNGCTMNATTDVTFSDDGATATGLISLSISCSDGSSCSGTYQITSQRQ